MSIDELLHLFLLPEPSTVFKDGRSVGWLSKQSPGLMLMVVRHGDNQWSIEITNQRPAYKIYTALSVGEILRVLLTEHDVANKWASRFAIVSVPGRDQTYTIPIDVAVNPHVATARILMCAALSFKHVTVEVWDPDGVAVCVATLTGYGS